MNIDPPVRLPVDALSVSSVALYLKCPTKWKRRYIEREYEASSAAAVVGHAIGRAEGHSYQLAVSGEARPTVTEVLDLYADEFAAKVAEEAGRGGVEWDSARPGRVKDEGSRVLALYHRTVAPHVRPVSTERAFEISFPGLEWTFRGYLDVEDRAGAVIDLKSRSPSKGVLTREEAAGDIQVDGYLFAKRAEARAAGRPDSPAGFCFHSLVRHPRPKPGHVAVTPAVRTHAQLDRFLALLYRVAAEIAWRADTDVWTPAPPGAWWCSQRWCGFWATCPYGGANQAPSPPPRPLRAPTRGQVAAAVKATSRRDGTTTAARVGTHLGVSTRSAAGLIRGLCQEGTARSERPAKRTKTKPPVMLGGPNVYRLLDDGLIAGQLAASLKQIDQAKAKEALPA